MVWLVLLLLLLHKHAVNGQGLQEGDSLGGQACDAVRLQQFEDIAELAADYSGGKGGRGGSGSRGRRHLLQGLFTPIAPRLMQRADEDLQGDCATCVGHAVAACAEASLSAYTGLLATNFNFSGESLYYCGAGGRVCGTTWTISAAMATVSDSPEILRRCQYVPTITQAIDVKQLCDAATARCSPAANFGTTNGQGNDLQYPLCVDEKTIDSFWAIQMRIRQLGGVVTRININNPKSFDSFFHANPTGIYLDTSTCTSFATCGKPFGHAVLNSYSPEFADGGRFRIAYGVAGVGNAPDTYALNCQPTDEQQQQQQRRLLLTPLDDKPGCYSYTVNTSQQSDLSVLSATLGVNIVDLVQANMGPVFPIKNITRFVIDRDTTQEQPAAVPNVGVPLAGGATLTVCKVPKSAFTGRAPQMTAAAVTGFYTFGETAADHDEASDCGCQPGKTLRALFKDDALGGITSINSSSLAASCVTCAPDTWKSWVGNGPCLACPTGSQALGLTADDHDEQSDCQ
eukprot:gene1930-2260_t